MDCIKCGKPVKDTEDSYCSLECWYAVLRKPRPKCLMCPNPVNKLANKMCSVSCSNRYKYQNPKNHPSWRGGRSKWLQQVRNQNWRPLSQWREAVLKRDNYTCQLCGAADVKLQADHIKPFRYFPELRFELSNGRALCVPCHIATPTYGRKKQELLGKTTI